MKSILFINLNKKIGDAVVSTFIFREIKKQCPDTKITILISNATKQIYERNEHIDKIVSLTDSKKFRRLQLFLYFPYLFLQHFDLAVNIELSVKKYLVHFIKFLRTKEVILSDKRKFDLIKCTPLIWDYNDTLGHITQVYIKLLNILGIKKNISTKYDVTVSQHHLNKCKDFINKNNLNTKKILLINPEGAHKERQLSNEYIKQLVNEIKNKFDYNIVLLCYKRKYPSNFDKNIFILNTKDIMESVTIVYLSDLIITVDTSIVHIADCYNKDMITLYPNTEKENNLFLKYGFISWCSTQNKTIKIQTDIDKNINDIPIESIITNLNKFN